MAVHDDVQAAPDRVPTTDWNSAGPEMQDDPLGTMACLRAHAPVPYSDVGRNGRGPHWSLMTYEDIVEAARDTDTFRNVGASPLPPPPPAPRSRSARARPFPPCPPAVLQRRADEGAGGPGPRRCDPSARSAPGRARRRCRPPIRPAASAARPHGAARPTGRGLGTGQVLVRGRRASRAPRTRRLVVASRWRTTASGRTAGPSSRTGNRHRAIRTATWSARSWLPAPTASR